MAKLDILITHEQLYPLLFTKEKCKNLFEFIIKQVKKRSWAWLNWRPLLEVNFENNIFDFDRIWSNFFKNLTTWMWLDFEVEHDFSEGLSWRVILKFVPPTHNLAKFLLPQYFWRHNFNVKLAFICRLNFNISEFGSKWNFLNVQALPVFKNKNSLSGIRTCVLRSDTSCSHRSCQRAERDQNFDFHPPSRLSRKPMLRIFGLPHYFAQ